MDEQLRALAENRYQQQEFLTALFELAVEDKWLDLQQMVQHDMAKAILADYSYERGQGYLSPDIFFSHWEDVIAIGWRAFCSHTGLPMDKVHRQLQKLHNSL